MTQQALEGLKGVDSVEVRHLSGIRGSVQFQYNPSMTDISTLQSALEKVNLHYRVVVGAPGTVPIMKPDIDFRVLSRKGGFEIDPALMKGKKTLFLFLEEEGWASLRFEMKVEPLAQEHGLAVRVIYLADPVAREQFKRDFEKKTLPYLRLYDERRRYLGDGNSPDQLRPVFR